MLHVGIRLIRFRREHPNPTLIIWKVVVSEAYRLLSVHPHWQQKQVITFHDMRRVDWRNTFGGRASGASWITFMALVDNRFGFGEEDDLVSYCPYNRNLPRSQAALLDPWDKLGIPQKEKKQNFGIPLTIIDWVRRRSERHDHHLIT
jgi:hypothetical protein